MYLAPSILYTESGSLFVKMVLKAISAAGVGVWNFISVSLGSLFGVGGIFFAGAFCGFLINADGFCVGGAVGSTAGLGAGCCLA